MLVNVAVDRSTVARDWQFEKARLPNEETEVGMLISVNALLQNAPSPKEVTVAGMEMLLLFEYAKEYSSYEVTLAGISDKVFAAGARMSFVPFAFSNKPSCYV